MGRVIAGMASSHAFALSDPSQWDAGRQRNREMYARRYGALPPEQPQVAEETDEDIRTRYSRVRESFDFIQRKLEETRPDALILVGDDQNENFTEDNLPQIAIYLGEGFIARGRDRTSDTAQYRCDPGLAEAIFFESVDADIDMASVRTFPDNVLLAHAFGPILRRVDPEARVPVVLVFVNAIHVPAPSARRCYYYGQTIRRAVEKYAGAQRVAVYASGGLSHFTGGYPYKYYRGPVPYGSIGEEFDRQIVAQMAAGEGHRMAELTNDDIIGNGEIEFRSWITMLGAIGDARPQRLVYEPFYRGLMGMAVGYWGLED